MSWFKKYDRSFLQTCAIRILQTGPIPRHLAFIMDGNRRYANKNHLSNVITGHEHGFEKLTEVCIRFNLCLFRLNLMFI
jgi:undecaprenyl pyrophosphate synthase